MTPERRRQITELFHAARALDPRSRDALLADACRHDAPLREEVEALLAGDRDDGPLGDAAITAQTNPRAAQIAPGTRIGAYVIRTLIGAGGMGEVYRAHDTALGRDVAIKILPEAMVADPDRRARFEREARVLAALNHPNIAAIYGLVEDRDRRGLVLELVEGPMLTDVIARGPLPLARAIALARQIALALEAAHDKNIVHRDLKPANVKVAGDVVKVLDFGLARLTGAPQTSSDAAPTITRDGTRDGLVMGTPAYMSPEQARGQPVDKRSDIWSFGCVLYEMLTSRRCFGGETVADTIAAVVERAPDWNALPAATPEAVRTVLRRCLEKDPAHRLRDIRDVRLELDDALVSGPEVTAPAGLRPRSRRAALILGVAAVAVIGGIALWPSLRTGVQNPGDRAPATLAPLQLTRLTFDDGLQTDPALSPDGRFVIYTSNKAGNFDLYTQPVGGGNPVQVTRNPAHDWQPDWSVNDQIVFRSERDGGGLYVVAQTGGHETRVAAFGQDPQWSPDGGAILFTRMPAETRHIVKMDGAPSRQCEPCRSGAAGWFRDARHVSHLRTEPGPQFVPHLAVVDLETGATEEWTVSPNVVAGFRELGVSVSTEPLAWSPDFRAIFFAGTSRRVSVIWSLDVDPDTHRVSGGPHRMASMAYDSFGVTAARTTRAIAFSAAARIARIWSYPLDRSGRRTSGRPKALTQAETESYNPDITPNGRLLAFSVWRPGGQTGLELRMKSLADNVERTVRVSDTARGELRDFLRLSNDGSRAAFRYVAPESEGRGRGGGQRGHQSLRIIDLQTLDETPLTSTTEGVVLPNGWSVDGRFVVATLEQKRVQAGATGMAIGLLPVDAAPDAERQMRIATRSDRPLWQPSISPNGRWLAFVIGQTFRIAVIGSKDGRWAEPQAESAWRYLDEDLSPKDKPRWSWDGRVLYFTSARGGLLNVWAVDFDPGSGVIGTPFRVTSFDGPGEQIPTELGALEIGVARGQLAVPTLHPTGAIWLLHPPR